MAVASGVLADEIGYDALLARLSGQAIPTGAGIRVAQVEASVDTNPLTYGPDQSLAEFSGKSFFAQSGTPLASWHATTVGQLLYSNSISNSIATGVTNIYLWEANSFITGVLRYGQPATTAPLVPPTPALKIYNHSWIGGLDGATPTAGDNDILRRADFAMNRDDTLFILGMNNGATAPTYPLMAMGYHGLSVGRMDGDHSHGNVPGTADGPGRMKPEIVAPGNATSWTAPVVGSVAALLFETAATHPNLALNTNADETVVIKAVLLAGARHRVGWTNNPTTSGASRGVTSKPLDATYGVDVVNVDRSHRILTAGERDGTSTSAAAQVSPPAAWDYESIPFGAIRYWRIRSTQLIPELSIIATWNRTGANAGAVPSVANVDLTLFRINAAGALEELEGEAGAVYYASGNVASRSFVDNIEHIYLKNLAAGEYVIEAKRSGIATTATSFALAWIMAPMLGDINQDGRVDGLDLAAVLSGWGGNSAGDVNGDGVVDGADLAFVLSNWG